MQNEKYRLEILVDLLNSHLGLTVTSNAMKNIIYTNAYFLGRHEAKLELLENLKPNMIDGNAIQTERLLIKFFGKAGTTDSASDKILPVLIHTCPEKFDTVKYFDVSIIVSFRSIDCKNNIILCLSVLKNRKSWSSSNLFTNHD